MKYAVALLLALAIAPAHAELDWDSALDGPQRAETNKARDASRHPRETLEFFGIKEGMTVVELSPGGGWYTEVLAPLVAESGKNPPERVKMISLFTDNDQTGEPVDAYYGAIRAVRE